MNVDIRVNIHLIPSILRQAGIRKDQDMRYAVIIEKGKSGYCAYVPDLSGCVAVARTLPQVKRLIHGAIEFHIEGLCAEGQRIPKPTSLCDYVQLRAA